MKLLGTVAFILLFGMAASAHVGSPDVYLDADAGAYKLFITIQPPNVIPGVAELQVRSETSGIRRLTAVPLPMTGPGSQHAPVPDVLKQSPADPRFFTGALWLMAPGSWQVRLNIQGAKGAGVVSVPIPAVALQTKTMDRGLGSILLLLMLLLVIGVIAMVSASVREADLPAGQAPDARRKGSALRAGVITATLVAGILGFGAQWWNSKARSYGSTVFKPLDMSATVQGTSLDLRLRDPGWMSSDNSVFTGLPTVRSVDDLAPDHGHLMHLYMLREPALDVVLHVHPEQVRAGEFRLDLPSMPAGSYKLYADIVHENGLPETLLASVRIPTISTHSVTGDDAFGNAVPIGHADVNATDFRLPDGYHMQWLRGVTPMHPREPIPFTFRLLDANGRAPSDMQLYMGMLGHAAFLKPDGTVFAHIHPTGTVAMAAFMKANGMPMNMDLDTGVIPDQVTFPYGFPKAGRYRIIVQMKHGSTVETGVFDAVVN